MVGLWYAANSYMVANELRNENFVIESIIRISPHYRCHSTRAARKSVSYASFYAKFCM
jgi:hypothetical protein